MLQNAKKHKISNRRAHHLAALLRNSAFLTSHTYLARGSTVIMKAVPPGRDRSIALGTSWPLRLSQMRAVDSAISVSGRLVCALPPENATRSIIDWFRLKRITMSGPTRELEIAPVGALPHRPVRTQVESLAKGGRYISSAFCQRLPRASFENGRYHWVHVALIRPCGVCMRAQLL